MIDLAIDPVGLSATIEESLGRRYRLEPLKVRCTYPVFKGETDGTAPVFIKVGPEEEWLRTVNLLKSVGGCGFFSRFVMDKKIEYKGYAVFVMEWKESCIVFPEDMTPRQIISFVAGCEKLSAALQELRVGADCRDDNDTGCSPEELFGDISKYVLRHPVVGRLLAGIVRIPAAERTYGNRPRTVIHGDFHAKNFGFAGDAFAAVYDFDKLTGGLACSDLVNALVERFSCLGLPRAARRRLKDITRQIVALAPWPREELAIACNVIRLQFAARRLRKHPSSAWVAFDVLRRDRKIREFLDCLEAQ